MTQSPAGHEDTNDSEQAASWDRPRRAIAEIEHHLGELFPRVGFIVTTLKGTNRAVVRFYNPASEMRLLRGAIAYNLGNLLRRLVLPLAIQSWSRAT